MKPQKSTVTHQTTTPVRRKSSLTTTVLPNHLSVKQVVDVSDTIIDECPGIVRPDTNLQFDNDNVSVCSCSTGKSIEMYKPDPGLGRTKCCPNDPGIAGRHTPPINGPKRFTIPKPDGLTSIAYNCHGTPSVVRPVDPSTIRICTHCSTKQRTTGVNQTTQTTGGTISPTQHKSTSDPSDKCDEASPKCCTANKKEEEVTDLEQRSTVDKSEIKSHINDQADTGMVEQNTPASRVKSGPHPSNDVIEPMTHMIRCPPDTRKNEVPDSGRNQTTFKLSIERQMVGSYGGSDILGVATIQCSTQNTSDTVRPVQQSGSSFPSSPRNMSRKRKVKEYLRRECARFFGVDQSSEDRERSKWANRQKRLAVRRFGPLKPDADLIGTMGTTGRRRRIQTTDRPDILPIADDEEPRIDSWSSTSSSRMLIERKPSVFTMFWAGLTYIVSAIRQRRSRKPRQWSRSFAPTHLKPSDDTGDPYEQSDSLFFDRPTRGDDAVPSDCQTCDPPTDESTGGQIYIGERLARGWRTRSTESSHGVNMGNRGRRISTQLLDSVLDNSRRPIIDRVKLLRPNELDERYDYRPIFTYWVNTVQLIVLIVTIVCYGVGPIGLGVEQKTGQVLVTSLSLQQVQHHEPRNVWIGPKITDLVHLGGKFAACMRRDQKIMDVVGKTRRQERETACCIRNDDSGCVQSSQADCSVRGWPSKSFSTWKKWSPGDSGPGGRISGSVCGLDPKYCDAPASIAPYEWPDDITKWPICRKTNSFSQRFRYKEHTAEHMICEVIGHPCCTGVYGECRITTREYCDFVNGYFHEEASLCSQISCLNDVCGMFPFLSADVPDQFYRLFTTLYLHAGILHLVITLTVQHIFLSDLERLIGPIRVGIIYIGSGVAGNLTSAIFVPYKPEVGPLASIAGIVASLSILLLFIHWKQLKKPHVTLIKLLVILAAIFGMGTLQWQQNFAGLIGGILFGIALTLALVPFVSLTKYGRKSKINLIWTCFLLHFTVYTVMFLIFYIFPNAFLSIGLGSDALNIPPSNTYGTSIQLGTNNGGGLLAGGNGNVMSCDKGVCSNGHFDGSHHQLAKVGG